MELSRRRRFKGGPGPAHAGAYIARRFQGCGASERFCSGKRALPGGLERRDAAGASLKLSRIEQDTIARWIDQGAEAARSYGTLTKAEIGNVTPQDRNFWAFRKPVRPANPVMDRGDGGKTPIDAIVLAKLREKKLGFSPQADRETLIRRAYFDLVGLPPPPQAIDAFVADRSPDAFERLVDRLLASPHFGERWGRDWLDSAGYADVYGIDSNPGDIRTGEGKWRYRGTMSSAP